MFAMAIIDVHTHVGDILNYGGCSVIDKENLPDRNLFDTGFKLRNLIDAGWYAGLIKYRHKGEQPPYLIREWGTFSNRLRNSVASVENMQLSLDASGVTYTCCLPIPPYVTFDDVRSIMDRRVIPFTGVDFTTTCDLQEKFGCDVWRGARGMKLHPIVQKVPLTSPSVCEAVEIFGVYNLPVLFHSGVTSYYHGKEKSRQEPAFGGIADAVTLVSNFPSVPFIVGHAGGIEVAEVISRLPKFSNVFVDTSFQSPENICALVNAFGSDRVLFASDWPYGDRVKSLQLVGEACKGDLYLREKILYLNSARLLRMNIEKGTWIPLER